MGSGERIGSLDRKRALPRAVIVVPAACREGVEQAVLGYSRRVCGGRHAARGRWSDVPQPSAVWLRHRPLRKPHGCFVRSWGKTTHVTF